MWENIKGNIIVKRVAIGVGVALGLFLLYVLIFAVPFMSVSVQEDCPETGVPQTCEVMTVEMRMSIFRFLTRGSELR
ncbi:hypothetical protein FWH09_01250 [Candidatus Saccharibacteria bacterium]|nr:hypothetical protein [Candidatus Saccharibacteria bacterium]